jgi:hypothetical protein
VGTNKRCFGIWQKWLSCFHSDNLSGLQLGTKNRIINRHNILMLVRFRIQQVELLPCPLHFPHKPPEIRRLSVFIAVWLLTLWRGCVCNGIIQVGSFLLDRFGIRSCQVFGRSPLLTRRMKKKKNNTCFRTVSGHG